MGRDTEVAKPVAVVLGKFGSYEVYDLTGTVPTDGYHLVRKRKGDQTQVGWFYPEDSTWTIRAAPVNPYSMAPATLVAEDVAGSIEALADMVVVAWEKKLVEQANCPF